MSIWNNWRGDIHKRLHREYFLWRRGRWYCTNTLPMLFFSLHMSLVFHDKNIASITPHFCSQLPIVHLFVGGKLYFSSNGFLANGTSLSKTDSRTYNPYRRQWRGYPWRQTTSSMNSMATVLVENKCPKVKKWAYLQRRSTTTRIVSNSLEGDKPSIKSIDISSKILLGMERGCNKPTIDKTCILFCWQIKHWST